MIMPPECPYCGELSTPATGKTVYPHRPDLHDLKFFECVPCEARVGCHKSTGQPMGRLANAALRKAKQKAHWAFDKIWKDEYVPSRKVAYTMLAERMGMAEAHIAEMDEEQCAKVIEVSHAMIKFLRKTQEDQEVKKDKTGYGIDLDKLEEMAAESDYWEKAYNFTLKMQDIGHFTVDQAMWLQKITSELGDQYDAAVKKARNY